VVTLEEAKAGIMSYEEFAEIKELEADRKEIVQIIEKSKALIEENSDDTENINALEEVKVVALIIEMIQEEVLVIEENPIAEEMIEDKVELTPIDFTKLSVKERAELLPAPTDDIRAEYDAYCEHIGYTEVKINSMRYKMSLYDEFMEEYDYCK